MNEIILEASEIHKSFRKADSQTLEILKGVSLQLEKNKISVVVGASGAGKSTLLHVLSGLDTADSGKVLIDGTDILALDDVRLSKFRNEHIGFVFQFHHLLPEFTALENAAMPLLIAGLNQKKAFGSAAELLDLVGLSERLNHKPAELSGGEQQRVAVARALANKPSIIFADEPTGNLDSQTSGSIHELFLKLKIELGLTFLVVTHNPELMKLGDVVLEMKDGILNTNE